MTADVRRVPRRGTPSACATKRMHSSQAREIVACAPRTRPSLGPDARARQSSLQVQRKSDREAGGSASRMGKPGNRKNHHWGRFERTERGSPLVTASARERAWQVRKGSRSRPASLRGSKSPGLVPARRSAVAEVGRRRLASNKLGKRAPKRADRVE
jgi:hypothetical protein